ncbi:odorant receptor 43b [Scaptodrosophila lebanonensis]|uniref:Odorant receptor 43b n=1 Tax=Drosophila lebanonensis TaxID=7225 RepID=A0A6J2SY81_DROLE|nr:odorant receptor 43b [Scaptodrosophila lebanonensis]
MFFKRIYPAPLSVPTGTRDSNIYTMNIFRISGMNLNGDISYWKLFWRLISYFYIMCYLPLSFLLSFIKYYSEFTPASLLITLQLALNSWFFTLKFIAVVFYEKRMEQANKCLDSLDVYCVSKEEQLRIRGTVAKCNKLYLIFTTVCFCYATSSFLDALLNNRVAFNTYYPFVNWREGHTQLIVHAFVEYVLIGYSILVVTAVDCYGVMFVEALREHVNLLKDRVQKLGGQNMGVKLDTASHTSEEDSYAALVECIEAHKTMLDQRYKKAVLQFMLKLQHPMTFTAMNIFNINLATNINVAKFALTVYTIAKGFHLEDKMNTHENNSF